jgi:hypothetical protein
VRSGGHGPSVSDFTIGHTGGTRSQDASYAERGLRDRDGDDKTGRDRYLRRFLFILPLARVLRH